MKKPTRKKSHSANKTKIAIAATILAIPLFSLPGTGFAEVVDYFLKQSKDKFSIAGSSGGHTVYKNTEGKFFYLDPNGDMKFIAFDPYLKVGSKLKKAPTTSNAAANLHIKMTDVLVSSYSIVGLGDGHTIYKNAKGESFYLDPANGDMKFLADEWIPIKGRDIDIKGQSNVSILGVDAKGNTVNENSRGEKFYLDALTGDMVFVDGSGLTPFHAASPESSGAPGVSGKPDTRPPVGPASEAKVVLHDISITKRGTAPRPSGISDQAHTGDEDAGQAPGISLNFAEIKTDYSSAPKKDGAGKLPGIGVTGVDDTAADGSRPNRVANPRNDGAELLPGTVTPISGIDVGLEGDPGSVRVSVKTNKGGAFSFSDLPEGKYKLKLPGLPDRSLTVGDKGAISGKVMRSSDGFIRIWDDTDIVHSTAISQTISYTGLERTAPSPRAGKLPGITITGVDDPSADGNQPYKTAPRQAGGGVKPGTAVTGVDDAAADGPQTYRAAPTPNSEDVKAAMVRNPEPFNDPKSNSAKAATGYKEVGSAKYGEYEEVSPGTARARAPNVSPTTKVLSGEQQGSAKGVAQGSAKGAAQGSAKGVAQGSAKGVAQGSAKGVAQGSAKGAAQGSSKGVAQGGAMRLVVTDGDIETGVATRQSGGGEAVEHEYHKARIGVATRQSGGGETALGGPDTASRIPPKSSEGKPTSAAGFAPLRPAEFKNASTLPKGEGNQLPGSVEQRGRVQLDADSNEQTTRSARGGGDVAMEELRNAGTPPNNGDETLPGTATPISGIPVGLEGDPGSVRVSVKTNKGGAFSFSDLPEGKYKLKLPGLPDRSLTVGPDGKFGGNLMQGSNGSISIFDRRGNLITDGSPRGAGSNGAASKANRTGNAPSGDYEISRTRTGAPPSVDPGGPPVTVQLRNVDTGQLAGTMRSLANEEFTLTGLNPGNWVVEIVDAAGKIIGTSASIAVAAGGAITGKVGQSDGGAGYTFFDVFTEVEVPIHKNVSADKAVKKTPAGSDAAESPVGFGKGMLGSPGNGPDVRSMNGPGPGMMSLPGGMGGGPAGGPGAMSPGGPGGAGGLGNPMRP